MSAFFDSPHLNGQQWQQPNGSWPSSSSSSSDNQQQQIPPSTQHNQQQVYAMQLLMHQMQQTFTSANGHHHQPFQTAAPASMMGQQKLLVPSPQDNALLAQIIHEQTKRGLTYKAALESLHQHNGIMAYAWKDYYLENKEIVDEMVYSLRGVSHPPFLKAQTPRTQAPTPISERNTPDIQLPSKSEPDAESRDTKPVFPRSPPLSDPKLARIDTNVAKERRRSTSTPLSALKKRGRPKKSESAKLKENGHSSTSSKTGGVNDISAATKLPRRTMNSLSSAPSNELLRDIPSAVPIDPETGLPAAPSRSPSPPPPGLTSRYTEADTIFFYKRLAYDLKRDPELTKNACCDLLFQKAPHHSALSWKMFWTKNPKVADKMYLLTELYADEDREAAIRSWKGPSSSSELRQGTAGRTARKSPDNEENGGENEMTSFSSSEFESSSEEESSSSFDEDELATASDEELGKGGELMGLPETRILAKYIMTRKNAWYKEKKDWSGFQTLFPETNTRNLKCWKEFYRRKQADVDKMVKRYARRANKEANVSAQRGRPSWARSGNLKKRRLLGIGSEDSSQGKESIEGH